MNNRRKAEIIVGNIRRVLNAIVDFYVDDKKEEIVIVIKMNEFCSIYKYFINFSHLEKTTTWEITRDILKLAINRIIRDISK